MMTTFCDMHCHLDKMEDGTAVARAFAATGSFAFSSTVVPADFPAAHDAFSPFGPVGVGLGLHPWYLDAPTLPAQVAAFEAQLSRTPFVGEVGIDAGKRHAGTLALQTEAFEAVARSCAGAGGKLISLHSVKSARIMLDILEQTQTLERCTCIFHWFIGPADQLARAIDDGCYFSVGAHMARSRQGRAYVKAIPRSRLLLETDAPATFGAPVSFDELQLQLRRTAEDIGVLRGENVERAVNENAQLLMERYI